MLHNIKVTYRRLYFAYRHSIRSGRTELKEFLAALQMACEVYN